MYKRYTIWYCFTVLNWLGLFYSFLISLISYVPVAAVGDLYGQTHFQANFGMLNTQNIFVVALLILLTKVSDALLILLTKVSVALLILLTKVSDA